MPPHETASQHKSEESAFNFALEYLKSIKVSLDSAKFCAVRDDYVGWYKWLRAAFREISLITDSEKDDPLFEEKFFEINKLMNNPSARAKQVNNILYLLDKLEIKIRKTIQKKGMGLPKSSDPRFAVLKR